MVKKFNEWVTTNTREYEGINTMSIDDISEYLLNTYPKYKKGNRVYSTKQDGLIEPAEDGITMEILKGVDFIISNVRGREYECFLHFDDKEKSVDYLKSIKEMCLLKEMSVVGIEVINVCPLDNEPLTIEFCVNVIDTMIESDPDNAVYIKA